MSDQYPAGWTKVEDAAEGPPGWTPVPEEAEGPPGWTAAPPPSYTLGEKGVAVGKELAYGGTMAWSQGLKGMGLLEAAPVQQELRDHAAEQELQRLMSPEDSIPPEVFMAVGAKDIRDTKSYQRGVALEEGAAAKIGIQEGILPDIVRDVSRGVGQVGTNIGMGLIPVVGVPAALTMGVLGGIGEAGETAAKKGASPDEQQAMMKWGTAAGASELADNLIPRLGTIGQGFTLARRILTKAGTSAGIEGIQEGFQQWVQNLGARVEYDPNQSISPFDKEVLYNALVGALTGGIVGPLAAGRRAKPAPAQPGEEVQPGAGAPTQPGAPAAPAEPPAPAAEAPLPPAQPVPEAPAVPVSAAPAAPDPHTMEVLQGQRFELQKQLMVAESIDDDVAAEALEMQISAVGQQLRSLKEGAGDPLVEAADLARLPLREALERSAAEAGPLASGTEEGPERILHVAVRRGGEVSIGMTHPDAIYDAVERSGGSIDAMTDADYAAYENGFLTNTGRFVTRAEADEIAREQGQLDRDYGPGGLSSENLAAWTDKDAEQGLKEVEEFSSRGRTGPASKTSPSQTAESEAPAAQAAPMASEGMEPDGAAQLQAKIQAMVNEGRELKKQGKENEPRYGELQFDIIEARKRLGDMKRPAKQADRAQELIDKALETPDVPHRPVISERPEWYYSAAVEHARQELPGTGTADSFWRAMQGPGVKKEELEWLGVKEWLDSQGSGQISKEDLLTHLTERAVTVETTVYGSKMSQKWEPVPLPGSNLTLPDLAPLEILEPFPPGTIPFQSRYAHKVYQAWKGVSGWMVVRGERGADRPRLYVVNPEGYIENTLSTLAVAKLDAETRINPNRLPRYDTYMPKMGMTNAREVVLNLPSFGQGESPIQLPKDWNAQLEPNGRWHVYDDEGQLRGSGTARQMALQDAYTVVEEGGGDVAKFRSQQAQAGQAPTVAGTPRQDVYSTKHFTEVVNKIGWVQVYDTRDVNGNKLLAVRGVQDDTRQKGAVEGYRDPKRIAAIEAQITSLKEEYADKERREALMDPLYDANERDYKRLNQISLGTNKPAWDKLYGEITARNRELDELRKTREWTVLRTDMVVAQQELKQAQTGIPDVPFKGQWHEVLVKRILRMAADEGYDGVMFPPPEQPSAEWGGATNPGLDAHFQTLYGKKIPSAYAKWGTKLGGTLEAFTFEAEQTTALSSGLARTLTWGGVRVTPEMQTEVKKGVPLFSQIMEGPKGTSFLSKDSSIAVVPDARQVEFEAAARALVQFTEVMQVKFGLDHIPIEVRMTDDPRFYHEGKVRPGEMSWLSRDPTNGKVLVNSKTGKLIKATITISPRRHINAQELYATYSHEFAHIIDLEHLASAPLKIKLALSAHFETWKAEREADPSQSWNNVLATRDNFVIANTVRRDQSSLRHRRSDGGRWAGDATLGSMDPEKRRYWLSQDEYQAENIARWFTTNEKALTVIDKYFKSLAAKLRESYTAFRRRFGTAEPNVAVEDYLSWIMRKVENQRMEIHAGADKASQAANQRAMDADGATMKAVPQTSMGQDIRTALDSVPLPSGAQQQGKALAAYADYFNRVYQYMAGLPHLVAANLHLGPLTRYGEIIQQWDLAISNMVDTGTRVLKTWKNAGDLNQQDAISRMIDDYRNMRYLTPQEQQQGVERMPTPLELDALAAKHGVNKAGQQAFADVMASYKQVIMDYRTELRSKARKIADPLRRQVAYHDIDVQINNILKKPFVPGMQFGNWLAIMRDSTGKIIHRESFDTRRKRNAAMAQLEQQKPPGGTVTPSYRVKDVRPLVGLPPGMLELIEQKLVLSKSQQDAMDELKFELHPTQSFKHRFSSQNLVAGSSKDFMRGYANFFFHGAHFFGRIKFQEAAQQEAKDLKESAEAMYHQGGSKRAQGKREDIAKFVEEHLAYRLDPRPDFAILRSLGFLWYLGFVPAAALLNTTQIPLATMPFLGAKFGDRKSIAAIIRAGASISSYYKKGTMATQTDEQLWALDQGIKAGTITEAMAPEMAAVAELDNLTRSTKGYTSRAWHKTLEWSAKQFELAEQFNRRVTFRATYALAKSNPNAKYVQESVQKHQLQYQSILLQLGSTVPDPAARAAAFVTAKDATEQTQGIYKQYAEPRFMRGKWRTVFIFKSFAVNMLAMYWNNKGTRWRGLLAYSALGGLMGWPFAEDVKGLIRILGEALDKDWDSEKEIKKLIMGLLGDDEAEDAEWADTILHGMSRNGFGAPAALQHMGVPGPKIREDQTGYGAAHRSGQVDMSRAISLGRGIPVDLNAIATSKDKDKAALQGLAQAGGAVYGGMPFSLYKFMQSGYHWDDRKAYEYIMPRFLKSVSGMFRAFEEGRERDVKGNTVLRYDRSDPWQVADMIGLGLGFQPARLTNEWDRRMAKMEENVYWQGRQQTIMNQLWQARQDPEEFQRVTEARINFNREVAGTPAAMYAITRDAMLQSFKNRAKGAQSAETGIPVRRREIPIAQEVDRLYPGGDARVRIEKEKVR